MDGWHDSDLDHSYHAESKSYREKPKTIYGQFNKQQGRIIIVLVMLFLILPFGTWLFIYSPYFHSVGANPNYVDPVTTLWTAVQSSDFNGYKTTLSGNQFVLHPNSTDSSIILSKTPIGDLSPVAGKDLVFSVSWTYNSGACCGTNQYWGFYLTTNATVPTQHGYILRNDPNVAFFGAIFGDPTPGTIDYQSFAQKKQGETIASEDSGNCSQAGSPFICQSNTIDPTTHIINMNILLNYTGASAVGTCPPNGLGVGCSTFTVQTDVLPPSSVTYASTQTLPWFQFQSVSYYFGFFATFNLPFAPSLVINGGGSVPFSPQINSQTPTVGTGLAPTIDTGGFFGPVIRALIAIGVFIAQNIISFLVFLYNFFSPLLVTLVAIFGSVFTIVFNAIGGIFGDSSLGTQIAAFLSNLSNYLAQTFSGAIAFLNLGLTYLNDALTIINSFFNAGNAFIGLWTGFLGGIGTLIGALNTFFGYLLFFYNAGVFGFNIIIIFALIILAMASLVDYEQSQNPIALFVGIGMVFFTFYTMTISNTSLNIIATNATILANYQTAFNNTVFFVKLAPVLFVLMLANYLAEEDSTVRSFTHGSDGFMHNFVTTIHFYQMITIDAFKVGYWFFRESYDLITKGISALKGRWSPVEVAGTG